MVSVNNWIEYQGGRTPVTDTGWVILAIKGDRTGCPWIDFGQQALQRRHPLVRACAPFGYVSDVDHVHCFYFGGKLLLTPGVRMTGLVVIFAWRSLPLVFAV